MPKFVHTIWLGGSVTDARAVTSDVRRQIKALSLEAAQQGMQVIVWTDITRAQLTNGGGEVANMARWARHYDIMLLNPDEVFHVEEPMRLSAEYKLETSKGTAAGYGAASDILRMEILYRFGGLYTDHDNTIHGLEGVAALVRAPGFAIHGDVEAVNNSAFLAARRHPFVRAYLDRLGKNYELRQDQLAPDEHRVKNSRLQQHFHYLEQGLVPRLRRLSVIERTGPDNLSGVVNDLRIDPASLSFISDDRIEGGAANTWASGSPRENLPNQTLSVLQHAVSNLIWDLKNRRGDLNLIAVAPLIDGLATPDAGWQAVVGYIHSVPELRLQVQTVTYANLDPHASESTAPLHEVSLPQSVRDTLGLPPPGHPEAAPGVWRRAAYGVHVPAGNWSYIAVDFDTGQGRLQAPTPDMRALVEHLRDIITGDVHLGVEVQSDVGAAGMDRARSVREHLIGLAAGRFKTPYITALGSSKRATGLDASSMASGPGSEHQVVIRWEIRPIQPAGGPNPRTTLTEGDLVGMRAAPPTPGDGSAATGSAKKISR
jgi:hypothetical protein